MDESERAVDEGYAGTSSRATPLCPQLAALAVDALQRGGLGNLRMVESMEELPASGQRKTGGVHRQADRHLGVGGAPGGDV